MADSAEFPLPADATDEERETAKREIGRYTTITGEDPRAIRFEGRSIGQTGPIWHLQYTRLYQIPKGYLVAAHDLREGIKVAYAEQAERLSEAFENEGVREFIEDELRYRGVIGSEHAKSG